jgi:hypothetical protein
MPDLPPARPAPQRRRRGPSAQRFVAGALASAVAVFGVLALRVHAGDDPALGPAKASSATTTQSSSSAASSPSLDPYAAGTGTAGATSGGQSASASSSGGQSSPAPTTRAS